MFANTCEEHIWSALDRRTSHFVLLVYSSHKTLVRTSLWSIKLWSPWKYALSSEWTRSLEHWLGSGQHYLDKYKWWGILTLSPFTKNSLHYEQRSNAMASGRALNLSDSPLWREGVYPPVGIVSNHKSSTYFLLILTFFSSSLCVFLVFVLWNVEWTFESSLKYISYN